MEILGVELLEAYVKTRQEGKAGVSRNDPHVIILPLAVIKAGVTTSYLALEVMLMLKSMDDRLIW